MPQNRGTTVIRLLLALLFLCGAASRARAQAGGLDPEFNSALGSGTVNALAVQADGKVIAGGSFTTPLTTAIQGLFRLRADGTLDSAFAADVRSEVKAIGLQSDGRILVGGGGFLPLGLIRLETSGSRDTAFAPAFTGNLTPEVQAIAVKPDGRIVIVGEFNSVNGVDRPGIARLNADGTLDTTFRPAVQYLAIPNSRPAVALQPDGKILFGGRVYDPTRREIVGIARLSADGSMDPSFITPLDSQVLDIAVQADGRIVLAGSITVEGVRFPRAMVRLLADGTRDPAFDLSFTVDLSVSALATEADGRLLAVTTPIGEPASPWPGRQLLRFNSDGTLDPTFIAGADPDGEIHTLRMLPDGRLLAAGAFTTWDGWPAKGVAKIQGGDVTSAPPAPAGLVATRESRTRIALSWDKITAANGCRIERLSEFTWTEIGRTRGGENSFTDSAVRPGVIYQYRVIAWNALGSATSPAIVAPLDPPIGAGSLDLSYAPMLTAEGSFSLVVPALDGKFFAAGDFQLVNGGAHRKLVRLWPDGSADPQFIADLPADPYLDIRSIAPLPDGRVAVCYRTNFTTTLGLDLDGGKVLVILGADGRLESEIIPPAAIPPPFSTTTSANRVAALWSIVYYVRDIFGYYSRSASVEAIGLSDTVVYKPVFNGPINGLIPRVDGSVVVFGFFSEAIVTYPTSVARPGIARLKMDLSLDPWTPSGLPAGSVVSAAQGPGDTTYVAVSGGVIGGSQVQIVRLLGNGAVDAAFAAVQLPRFPAGSSNPFRRLSVAPDGSVISVFGSPVVLDTLAGPLSSSLLRHDGNGTFDEAWSRKAATAGAQDLFVLSSNGRALIAQPGSETNYAGYIVRQRLRWLDPDGSPGALFASALRTGATAAVGVRVDGATVVSPLFSNTPPYSAVNGTRWATTAWLRDDGSLDPGFALEISGSPGGLYLTAGRTLRFDEFDRLLVSGTFTQFNGFARNNLARLNADRTTDEDFEPALPETFSPTALATRADGRIAVGTYPIGSEPTAAFRSLLDDGSADGVAENVSLVSTMAAEPDGGVLFVGSYSRNGMKQTALARLTADNQLDPNYAPQIMGGNVSRVLALPDGRAIVAGSFNTVDGVGRAGLARLEANGSLDRTFDPGRGANAAIHDVAAQHDGKLIIVGEFTSYAGAPRGRVARLEIDGSLDRTFLSGDVDGPVRQVVLLPDGRMVLAGEFSAVDSLPRTGLARLLPGPGPFPPAQPAALRALQLSASEVQLIWDDVRRETGYRIESRDGLQNDWTLAGSVGADVTQFIVGTGSPTSQYRVIAIGPDGESTPSSPTPSALPGTPRSLTATAISLHAIRLVWSDVTRETGFRIERSDDGLTGWMEIAIVDAGTTSYTDSGLSPGIARHYRVTSFNLLGTSEPSDVASATTWPDTSALPGIPRSFTATAISFHAIRLVWADVSRESGYRIERSEDGLTGWMQIATVDAGKTTYSDFGLSPGITRHYRVSSFNFAGTSAPSDFVSATTWSGIFPAAYGRWSGLITTAGAFTKELSGALAIRVNRGGNFTGSLNIGRKRVALRGKFTSDGIATGVIAHQPGLLDGYALSVDPLNGIATGSLLLDGSERASMRLHQAGAWSALEPCPFRGAYTLLIQSDAADPMAPEGIGFGRVLVNTTGALQFVAVLADATVVSQGATICANGHWPLFALLYQGSGALSGWLEFGDDGRLRPSGGPAHWTKPHLPRAAVHREAFSIMVNLFGNRYQALRPVWSPIPAMQITFGLGDLAQWPGAFSATLNEANAIATSPGSGVTMNLSTATGLLSGRLVLPGERGGRTFAGAILQLDVRGGGFFHGQAKSGSVLFEKQNTGGEVVAE